jgi:hypothetical protein
VTKMLRARAKKIPDGRGVEDDCTPSGEVGVFQPTNEAIKADSGTGVNTIDDSGALHAVPGPGQQCLRCTQCLVRCPPHMGKVCRRCQKDGVPVCAFPPPAPQIGLKLITPIQCIGSEPCLRCIELHGACSYETSSSNEDEYAGRNLLELTNSLEVLKDDGSVPLAMKITFA